MLTVVIPTLNAAGSLPGLLAVLVPAAVDGLVREVIVADPAPTAETRAICEDAGAELVATLAEAAGRARYETVLVLPADMRLKPDWQTAVAAHLARGGRAAVLAGEGRRWFRPGPTGVLTDRDRLAGARDLARLVRAGGGRL